MRNIDITALGSEDLNVRELEIFPESWTNRVSFSMYEHQPRPCSALFIICTDIRATFHCRDGHTVLATRGDVVYIPKNTCYYASVVADQKAHTDSYTINFRLFDHRDEEINLSDNITILAVGQEKLFPHYAENLSKSIHHSHKNHMRIKAEFYTLLDAIVSAVTDAYDTYYPIRAGVEALCSQWDQNVKIEEYAAMCSISSTYFYQCFRRWSGKSPVEYRNMLRISNAETMLRLTDMPIAQIAEMVGYEDSFYFCRIFTRQYGKAPQKYRKEFRISGNIPKQEK